MQEVPDATVARAALYVDSREAAWAECGELYGSLARGSIGRDHVRGEIGALAAGTIPGRQSEQEITMFKSVGLAAQDLFCAAAVYQRALATGQGVQVRL
jgi:ornithine cyclodeaminase/alanine dehydrogenase-like protein (mu-crystallin family)